MLYEAYGDDSLSEITTYEWLKLLLVCGSAYW
jgi:hypothetical protein